MDSGTPPAFAGVGRNDGLRDRRGFVGLGATRVRAGLFDIVKPAHGRTAGVSIAMPRARHIK
jgi:hypothetical protein